jgi:hypothetical protein
VSSGINSKKNGQFTLEQNYPNPFDQKTTFSYNIPSKSLVTLKVIDLNGREVSSLVSGELQTGKYTREWDGSDFPGGVYFCQLQAGTYRETKKLIILK